MGNLVKNTAFNQFKCFRPRVIANKYTGELVTIRCGHCEACRLARSNERTSKLERVREVAKCTFFGTLTYADDFLPVMNFDNRGYDIPLDNEYNQVHGTFFVKKALVGSYYSRQKYNRSPSCCFVNIYDHELLDPVNLNELNSYEKDLIRNGYHTVGKVDYHPYQFGYLRKADLQKFFKRLRYYLSQHNINAANYYFACGEYGPQSLRPHYHFVISFDEVLPYEEILGCVLCSWQLGRVDLQSIKSSATSYVSGYITSCQNLPSFLDKPKIRPFSIQSLAKNFFKSVAPEDEKEWFDHGAHERVVNNNGKYVVIPLPTSFVEREYPLPSRLGSLCFEELRNIFRIYEKGYAYHLSQKRGDCDEVVPDRFILVPNEELSRFCSTKIDSISTDTVIPRYVYFNYLWYKKVLDLSLFRGCSVDAVIHSIVNWHNDEELFKLKRFYSTQQEYDGPFDVLTNLIQYPQIFAAFRCRANYKQLPTYLQKTFDLQGLTSYLYNSDGELLVDVSHLYKMDGFVNYRSLVLEDFAKRIKTKGANDAYNLI